jgi:hypothetical protein
MLKPLHFLVFAVLIAVGFVATRYLSLWPSLIFVNLPLALVLSSALLGPELSKILSQDLLTFVALSGAYFAWISNGSFVANKFF